MTRAMRPHDYAAIDVITLPTVTSLWSSLLRHNRVRTGANADVVSDELTGVADTDGWAGPVNPRSSYCVRPDQHSAWIATASLRKTLLSRQTLRRKSSKNSQALALALRFRPRLCF